MTEPRTISSATWQDAPQAVVIGYSDGGSDTIPMTREGWPVLRMLLSRLGLEDVTELTVDEETGQLLEPDLIGKEV